MIHVRSSMDTASTIAAIREALGEIDPNATLLGVGAMSSFVSLSLLPQRLAGWIAGSLGAVGPLLASVGLYGVAAYVVGIGIALVSTRAVGGFLYGASPMDPLVYVGAAP